MEKKAHAPLADKKSGFKEFYLALVGDRERANERLIGIIAGIALGFAAYFLGRCELLFGTLPLGIALLCAADKHLPFILIGASLSAGETNINPAVVIVTYSVVLVVRIFSRLLVDSEKSAEKQNAQTPSELAEKIRNIYLALFTESVYLRMASACIGAFCLSLYAIIVGGFRYYDLFGIFFSMVTAPVATFVFSAHFEISSSP